MLKYLGLQSKINNLQLTTATKKWLTIVTVNIQETYLYVKYYNNLYDNKNWSFCVKYLKNKIFICTKQYTKVVNWTEIIEVLKILIPISDKLSETKNVFCSMKVQYCTFSEQITFLVDMIYLMNHMHRFLFEILIIALLLKHVKFYSKLINGYPEIHVTIFCTSSPKKPLFFNFWHLQQCRTQKHWMRLLQKTCQIKTTIRLSWRTQEQHKNSQFHPTINSLWVSNHQQNHRRLLTQQSQSSNCLPTLPQPGKQHVSLSLVCNNSFFNLTC